MIEQNTNGPAPLTPEEWRRPKCGTKFEVVRLNGWGETEVERFTVVRDVTSMDLDVMLRDEDGFDRQCPLSMFNAVTRPTPSPTLEQRFQRVRERLQGAYDEAIAETNASTVNRDNWIEERGKALGLTQALAILADEAAGGGE